MVAAAKIPQGPALVLEKDPQHLGDGENDLVMRHIQEKRLPLLAHSSSLLA